MVGGGRGVQQIGRGEKHFGGEGGGMCVQFGGPMKVNLSDL